MVVACGVPALPHGTKPSGRVKYKRRLASPSLATVPATGASGAQRLQPSRCVWQARVTAPEPAALSAQVTCQAYHLGPPQTRPSRALLHGLSSTP